MAYTSTARKEISETPDADFWAECRRQSAVLGVPAWLLAEDAFVHQQVACRKPSHRGLERG